MLCWLRVGCHVLSSATRHHAHRPVYARLASVLLPISCGSCKKGKGQSCNW